jgi:hypothetical protein
MLANKYKFLGLMCFLWCAGCSVLAPEREAASGMMGQNIKAAYQKFGNPSYVDKLPVVSGDPLSGQTMYTFQRFGANYNTQSVTGSDIAPVNGQLTRTEYVETNNVQESCIVRLYTGADKIVDYFEVKGNCGLWDMGLGQTGAMHRYGIN